MANENMVEYRCRDKGRITVTQDPHIQNSSGGIVWETAYLMAMYFEQCVLPASGAAPPPAVLEVGAGCGLLGLVLARLGCRVVLTEQPATLPTLRRNVAANLAATAGRATALPLFWGDARDIEAVAAHGPFDLVVGTDVFFSPPLVEPLLATIHQLTGPSSTVYLCMQERCPDTHRQFLARAPAYFAVEDATAAVRGLPSARFAAELECCLFRLSGRRALDSGQAPTASSIPVGPEAPEPQKKRQKKRKRKCSEAEPPPSV
eukprot:EG_transcript_19827